MYVCIYFTYTPNLYIHVQALSMQARESPRAATASPEKSDLKKLRRALDLAKSKLTTLLCDREVYICMNIYVYISLYIKICICIHIYLHIYM